LNTLVKVHEYILSFLEIPIVITPTEMITNAVICIIRTIYTMKLAQVKLMALNGCTNSMAVVEYLALR